MENKHTPAYPCGQGVGAGFQGLTKREVFAMEIAKSLIQNDTIKRSIDADLFAYDLAEVTVKITDAIFNKLEP